MFKKQCTFSFRKCKNVIDGVQNRIKLFGPIYKFDLNYLVNSFFLNIQRYYEHAIFTKKPLENYQGRSC